MFNVLFRCYYYYYARTSDVNWKIFSDESKDTWITGIRVYSICLLAYTYVLHNNEAKYLISSPEKYYLIVFVSFRFGIFFFFFCVQSFTVHWFARSPICLSTVSLFLFFRSAIFLRVFAESFCIIGFVSSKYWLNCWLLILMLIVDFSSDAWSNIIFLSTEIISK